MRAVSPCMSTPALGPGDSDPEGTIVTVPTTPGTYYVYARVTSQRDGDPDAPYGQVQNLAGIRVVVR